MTFHGRSRGGVVLALALLRMVFSRGSWSAERELTDAFEEKVEYELDGI
jgi:hypothetical protein